MRQYASHPDCRATAVAQVRTDARPTFPPWTLQRRLRDMDLQRKRAGDFLSGPFHSRHEYFPNLAVDVSVK